MVICSFQCEEHFVATHYSAVDHINSTIFLKSGLWKSTQNSPQGRISTWLTWAMHLLCVTSCTSKCAWLVLPVIFTLTSDSSPLDATQCYVPEGSNQHSKCLSKATTSVHVPPLSTGLCDPWPCHPCSCVYFHATNVRGSSWTQAANHHTPH